MSGSRVIPELAAARLPLERGTAEWWLSRLGAAVDSGVLRAMQSAVDALMMPSPEELPALRASAEHMLDEALQREPARFFEDGEAALTVDRQRSRIRRRLRRGAAVQRRIDAHYRPWGAEPGHPGERTVLRAEHWMHDRQPPRGTLIAVHGFSMGRPRVDAFVLFAQAWYRRGLDVVLPTLPYHGARTPTDARFSGEHFAVPHVARLADAVRQAIFELELWVRLAREQTGGPVGVLGLSLGGYLSALLAGLSDDLDFAVPMVPPVCIGDLAWRFFERSRKLEESAETPFSYDELRRSYRVHSPLAHPLRLPQERVLIVAGRGDRVVPPEHPHSLWDHWGRPGIHWFGGSHLAPFGRSQIVSRIEQHLSELAIL